MPKYTTLLLPVLLLTVSSCNAKTGGTGSAKETSGPAAAVQTTTYKGVGTVKSIKPSVPSIEIDHDDIPGLMPAMQMEFRVKDKSLLENLEVENRVEFTVENGIGGLRIVALKRL